MRTVVRGVAVASAVAAAAAAAAACEVDDATRSSVGDGRCDAGLNTAACQWDGGDCCKDSCVAGAHDCTGPMECLDPETALFTLVFVSDIESNYRGHTWKHAARAVEYIKDLKGHGVTFDGEFAGVVADPALVIHGGDISADAWSCEYSLGPVGCRGPEKEMEQVWQQLYDSGIPMLSVFGNHDWAELNAADSVFGRDFTDAEKTQSNRKTLSFVRSSFDKSAAVAGEQLSAVEWFAPAGAVGQSTARAVFRGLQISLLMNHAWTKSYDSAEEEFSAEAQVEAHFAALDPAKPTMFVSHYPLAAVPAAADRVAELRDRMLAFPSGSHHFSGHDHVQSATVYNGTLTDYTAAYPYVWDGNKPGAYAVLASGRRGIVQVKPFEIKAKCWEAGKRCVPYLSCRTECCDNDKNNEFWERHQMWACGKEPCWSKGTNCVPGISCDQCCHGQWGFWTSSFLFKCGKEPCWNKGTWCGKGTTCKRCCSGGPGYCPWWRFGICKCS